MPVTAENVHDVVTYHKPTDEEVAQIQKIRDATENAIQVVIENSPPCADQTAAVRKFREGMMTANAAICLRGLVAFALLFVGLTGCNTSGANHASTFWGTTGYVEKKGADGSYEKYVGVNKDTINRIAERGAFTAIDLGEAYAKGVIAGQASPALAAGTIVPKPALPGEVARAK